MKIRIGVLALAAIAACRMGSTPVPEVRADDSPPASDRGVAVVELFTSEGCSSCPPADAVLARLARSSGRPIYALAFHVDYWDDLGWPDRFASPAHTARQRAYAHAFGARGLYTPQMVVGGTEELNGADGGRADDAVARALVHPASVPISLRVRSTAPSALAIDFDAPGAPAGSVMNIAVVERSASTAVRAGENAGRTLHHANVVRAFVSVPLESPAGSVPVQLPPSLAREGTEVFAYAQRTAAGSAGMPVLGAARAPLPPP